MKPAARLAGAPITWGVCEVPGWGRQLEAERVLAEMTGAGLTATELGPRGFLSDDPAEVRAQVSEHGLRVVAGFVPALLHRPDRLDDELARVQESARTLEGAGAEVLVLAAESGSTGYDASILLDDGGWSALGRGIAAAQGIARRHGLVVALHPHFGTVIESEQQVLRLLATTQVPLCLDTGHLVVAGADPLAVARAADGRVAHVHLKDVDGRLASRVRRRELGYRDAVAQGLYRPLGDGDASVAAVVRFLRGHDYGGWYVLEHDVVVGADGDDAPLRNARRSLRFLEGLMTT